MATKLAVVLAVPLFAGCYGWGASLAQADYIEGWNDPCQRLMTQYKQHPGHKAFALTTSSAGSGLIQYCGAAWGAGSKQTAESQAMASCKTKKVGKEWNKPLPQPTRCKVIRSE